MHRLLKLTLLFVTALAIMGANPAHGQGVKFFLTHDRTAEYVAGAGLNLLSRGPWIDKNWRRPVVRFIGAQVTSLAYERFFDYNGFNWSDYRQRLYGYLFAEVSIVLVRSVVHKR